MRSNNSLRRNGKYRRSMRQILGFNFYDVFVFLFCIVFALVCVYPMWYVLVASVTPYEAVSYTHLRPRRAELRGFRL